MSKDIDINEGVILETLNAKIDYDGGNYPSSGLETYINKASNAKYLNKNHITNCLLEVPQNIKLELADGVLTLKAGSKVIVPNGAGVFEEKTATVDCGMQSTTFADGQYMLFDNGELSTTTLRQALVSKCVSGTTAPSDTSFCWYNTTDNWIQVYQNDAWIGTRTLPLGIFTVSGGVITSIDQVFNGMGYIGSTIWVDKGVKGLASNGRNADGTLSNNLIEYTNVYTRTFTTSVAKPVFLAITVSGISDLNSANYLYNEKENKIQQISTGNFMTPVILAGTYNRGENGVITSFQPKLPVHLVDRNELREVQCVVETYVNGTSWYRVWSDGWCEQGGRVTGVVYNSTTQNLTFLKPFKDTNYFASAIPIEGVHAADTAWVYNKQTTGMVVKTGFQNGSATLATNWQACGYIK